MIGESLMLNRMKLESGSGRSRVTGSWFVSTNSSGARRRIVLSNSTFSFSARYDRGPCCSCTRYFGSDFASTSCHSDATWMLLLTEDKELSLPIKDRTSNATIINIGILITRSVYLAEVWAADYSSAV